MALGASTSAPTSSLSTLRPMGQRGDSAPSTRDEGSSSKPLESHQQQTQDTALPGPLSGPRRHVPPCFVWEPQAYEDSKMFLPQLPVGHPQAPRKECLCGDVLEVRNGLLACGLAERSRVRWPQPAVTELHLQACTGQERCLL